MTESALTNIDEDKVDDAVLALLCLTLRRTGSAWKTYDWDTMDRLHAKGFIDNPASKRKSVYLTEEGIARSEQLIRTLFTRSA